jgi:hypothetical protein
LILARRIIHHSKLQAHICGLCLLGQQEIIAWMEVPRNAEHLDFAFPFAGSFAMIRNGACSW